MHARELRFDRVPDTSVGFVDSPDHTSVSTSQRTNLPDQVSEDVPYERVTVDYTLATRVDLPDLPFELSDGRGRDGG